MTAVERFLKSRQSIALIAIMYLAFSLLYLFTVPLWEPPDEARHFFYCRYMAKNWRLLPLAQVPEVRGWHPNLRDPPAYNSPFYYAIGALFIDAKEDYVGRKIREAPPELRRYRWFSFEHEGTAFPFGGIVRSVYLLRLLSVLFGLGVVVCTYKLGKMLFQDGHVYAFGMAAMVAMTPQFCANAAVSTEAMLNLACALSLLFMARLVVKTSDISEEVDCADPSRDKPALSLPKGKGAVGGVSASARAPVRGRDLVMLGVIVGIALLCKLTALFLLPGAVVAAACLSHDKSRENASAAFRRIGLLLLVVAAVAGWWYVRNAVYYSDPTAAKYLECLTSYRVRGARTFMQWLWACAFYFVSYWGAVGQLAVLLSKPLAFAYGVLCLSALAGLAFSAVRKSTSGVLKGGRQIVAAFGVSLATMLVMLVMHTFRIAEPQGRYIHAAAPLLSLLFTLGLLNFFQQRHRPVAVVVVCFVLLVFHAVYMWSQVIPAFVGP